MGFKEWSETPDNVERNCDVCGEPVYDGLSQVGELFVCDNCYEDMQNDIEDYNWDEDNE